MSPSMFRVQEHTIPCQYVREYPGATLENEEDDLVLHVKQYTPLDQSYTQAGAITIIGTHANGFPKELYEPLWDDLSQALRKQGQTIRGIWIADVAQQGMSGVLNEDKLGNDPSWNDHSRDLLHMINHFRKEMSRPLVGVGHSMGGNQLVNLAYLHPRLLTSLVLIDPVIQTVSAAAPDKSRLSHTQASTFRRDDWPSRVEAASSVKKSKFYQSWDPRVLDLWIKYGLRSLPTAIYPDRSENDDDPVTLTTTKHQEVFTFLRPNFDGLDANGKLIVNRRTHPDLDLRAGDTYPFYRPEPPAVFNDLPRLRPSALYIFGGQSDLSTPDLRKQKVERTGTGVGGSGGAEADRVKEVVLEDVGHLVPMEAVARCAAAAGTWLASDLKRWRSEEADFKREWEAKERKAKCTISEEWKKNIGGDPRRKSEKL
ncbi:hypothetical protein HO173_011891 [Letharia columbiana]|uniref:AB hydrolase-1 domain-containing protein n=1 Tax=Letharia columbiana TaxID=112416 RepID=A0A8H6CQG7_9LECA|nr:uncharacterized protein HO173_011891 [Letharia columbiana]KAF6227789.1 hypothetical protein HO173_011891 [Letharia columbiana]